MKKNIIKVLGIVCATLVAVVLTPCTTKAAKPISEDGTLLEIGVPQGAKTMTDINGEQYAFDEKGNAAFKITVSGYQVEYQYDANGNLAKEIEHKYDGDPWGETLYEYDELGRIIIEKDGEGNLLYLYFYDGNTVTRVDQMYITLFDKYTYDDFGNLMIHENNEEVITYEYDLLGNIVKIIQIKNDGYQSTVEYTYDEHNNILALHQYDTHDFEIDLEYVNVYDSMGRLVSVTNGLTVNSIFTY